MHIDKLKLRIEKCSNYSVYIMSHKKKIVISRKKWMKLGQ